MDELQDAIEDAQYMNAMHNEMPRPIKEWDWPNPIEVDQYICHVASDDSTAVELETICKNCLGFYLV
jgi:hypothetical protein